MQHLIFPGSRAVGRRAGVSRRGGPVLRGALLAILGLLVGPGAWATDISSCPYTITVPGDYHVTKDLSCSNAGPNTGAITILANNVTLSLDGHTLTGVGARSAGEGVWVKDHSGASISGGTVSDFGSGIFLDNAPGCTVSGMTAENCSDGMQLDPGSTGCSITGNIVSSNGVSVGIEVIGPTLTSGGGNNQITNNTLMGNSLGIEIEYSGNTITGNTALNNTDFDLDDDTVNCSENVWANNCFMTANKSCIGTSSCGTPAPNPSPPGVTCPGNKTVTVAAGQTSATVVVGMATSDSEGATVVGVRSDGKALTAPYPVGATTITWMVMDANEQVATCTQTITVQAVSTPPILHMPNSANPHIVSIRVDRGPLQQEAIIHGNGFGDLQGTSYVTLGGHQIPVLAWTNDAINVLINPGAFGQSALALNAAYPVQVIAANGVRSNTVDFFLTDGPPAVYGP